MEKLEWIRTSAIDKLHAQLNAASASLGGVGVAEFLEFASVPGRMDHYKTFSPEARAMIEVIRADKGEAGVRLTLHSAILQGIANAVRSERFAALPPRVRHHQMRQFERIVDKTASSDEWLSLDNDLFHKDFGIAVLRLYAAAAQLVDPRCGIPRSIVLAGGVTGLARTSAAILRLGGFSPFLQIHTHTAYLEDFNEEGWNECYRTCADLYSVHPECLGMFGASWFYDPQIETISPRLSYLSHVPMKGGAERLFFAADGEFVADAVATSPTRRKMFEAGSYRPNSYMVAWGKRDQMRWASSAGRDSGRVVS